MSFSGHRPGLARRLGSEARARRSATSSRPARRRFRPRCSRSRPSRSCTTAGPDFKAIYDRTLARLKEVFRTEHDVLLFTASGTGAFESAVANLVDPGERHLVVSSGNFGERWAEMVAAYGAELVHLRLPWGESPSPEALAAELARSAR